MKNKLFSLQLIALVISLFIFSCGKDTTKKDGDTDKKQVTTDTTKKDVPNTDVIVDKIAKFRADGEKKLTDGKFTRKTVDFKTEKVKEDIKQKWEKMDAYYEGDKVVRIQLYPHKGESQRTEEFYIMDGKLAFCFIQDEGEKHEGKDMGEAGKEFYFDKDKLIKYVNNTKEPVKNMDEEKKMYESRLPYEVTELLDILKNVK